MSAPQSGEAATRKPTARAVTPPALADVALIDGPTAAAAACISISAWHELVRKGDAPSPAFRRPRCTRWRLADVKSWLVEYAKVADREAGKQLVAKATRASHAARAKRHTFRAGA